MRVSVLILLLAIIVPVSATAQKKNAQFYFEQGEAALEENKYTMALAHFNECLRLEPYFYDAYPSRAACREALGDKKGALTDYNIYINSRPQDAEAVLGRAVLRYQLQQYLPAREDFLSLLKVPVMYTSKILFRQTSEGTDKMFTLNQNNHAEFFNYLGLIEMRLKENDKALVYLDSAVRLSPQDPQNSINRGILKEHLHDTTGALADYENALKIDPSYGPALHNIAVIRRSRGQQTESLALLNDAIAKSPSLAAPYSERAYYYFLKKDFAPALSDYSRVLELNKADEESWFYRGLVKEKLKDLDGAFIDFTEAISLRNDYAKAWVARGTLLTKLKRLPEAIEDYSVAILWNPEYALAFYNRGLARQKTGKLKDACDDLRTAQRLGMMVEDSVLALACK